MNRTLHFLKAILIVMSLGVFCLSFALKNSYAYKGYFYKHPFFENKSLYTAQNAVIIEAPQKLLNAKLTSVTYSGVSEKSFGAYLSGDSIFLFTTDLLQDFCYSSIEYSEPKVVSVADGGVDSNTIIYAVRSKAADVFKLCVSGRAGRIYIYSIDPSSLNVQSKDSIILKNVTGSVITSISGASSIYNSIDSVLWITGSNGLLRSVHLGQNFPGEETVFDIATTETVECFGDGIAGTRSGSVYERKNSVFEKVFSTTGAIYSVNSRSLAGDGIIYVKNSSGWTKVKEGSGVRYRHCMVSATSSGSLYELIDNNWVVDSVRGSNTSTLITSVLPSSIYSYINSTNKYEYLGSIPETMTINLNDYEKNYEPLSIVLKTRNGSTEIGMESDGVELGNCDPSGICQIGKVSLADSSIGIYLTNNQITVTAFSLAGREDLICMQCALKPYTFKNEILWGLNDEIIIHSSTQTLSVINKSIPTSSILGIEKNKSRKISVTSGNHLSSIEIPDGCKLANVMAYDLSGQIIKAELAGDVIRLNKTGNRVVTLKILLSGGKSVVIRTILTRR